MMNEKQRGIIYVFFGSKAKELSYLISDQHNTKINVVHPASAAYKGGQWSSNNLFNNINSLLKASGSDEITW
jgi:uracil DNA glycosylase